MNRRITRITSNLTEELEREPTREEVAEALGIEEVELIALQSQAQPRQLVSFDEGCENGQGDESLPLVERLADPCMQSPAEAVHLDEDRRTLLKCVATLPKAQATVVNLHYLKGVPLREVAARLKVTPSRVSQLHHQALARMRQLWVREEE